MEVGRTVLFRWRLSWQSLKANVASRDISFGGRELCFVGFHVDLTGSNCFIVRRCANRETSAKIDEGHQSQQDYGSFAKWPP